MDSQDRDSDPPIETSLSGSSHYDDSEIEFLHSDDPSSNNSNQDIRLLHHQSEEREEDIDEFELDDSESATDSEYDATSDTELIRSRRYHKHSTFSKRFYDSYRKSLQTFSFVKLARKVLQRITDCVGGFFTCVVCLWNYDYTKCKPQNVRTRSTGWGKSVANGFWRSFKLILDRKVFLSVSLYGLIAFLAIVSNEVCRYRLNFDISH